MITTFGFDPLVSIIGGLAANAIAALLGAELLAVLGAVMLYPRAETHVSNHFKLVSAYLRALVHSLCLFFTKRMECPPTECFATL